MLGTQLTDGSLNRVHSSTHNYSFIYRERGREGEGRGGVGQVFYVLEGISTGEFGKRNIGVSF